VALPRGVAEVKGVGVGLVADCCSVAHEDYKSPRTQRVRYLGRGWLCKYRSRHTRKQGQGKEGGGNDLHVRALSCDEVKPTRVGHTREYPSRRRPIRCPHLLVTPVDGGAKDREGSPAGIGRETPGARFQKGWLGYRRAELLAPI